MKTGAKIGIVVVLAVAVAATFALRGSKRAEYVAASEAPAAATTAAQGAAVQVPALVGAATAETVPAKSAIVPVPGVVATLTKPRMLELGSMRCQACLEMAKVLDALRASQGAKLQVDFIDVFEEPAATERYKISLIPTQILFDAAGKEIFRHTGYFAHDDILTKFRDLGVKL